MTFCYRYQVQAEKTADISGSLVSASKPVAVYAGAISTNIIGTASDHLVEQMSPLHSFGRRHALVPFPDANSNYQVSERQLAIYRGEGGGGSLKLLTAGNVTRSLPFPDANSNYRVNERASERESERQLYD